MSGANDFEDMLNDTVYVEPPSGSRTGPYKAVVNSTNGQVTIFDTKFQAEEGWTLLQQIPNQREHSFLILEVSYSPGMDDDISPFWTLKVRKAGSLAHASSSSATFNISNSSGFQIGDHNTQHITNSLVGLIEKINESSVSREEKAEAKGLLRKLLENNTVAAVLGGAVEGVLAALT